MDHYELFQEYLRIDHQIDEFYHTLAQRQGLSDSALWVLWSLVELGEGSTQTDICRLRAEAGEGRRARSAPRRGPGDCPLFHGPGTGAGSRENPACYGGGTDRRAGPGGGGVADRDPAVPQMVLFVPGGGGLRSRTVNDQSRGAAAANTAAPKPES